MQAEQEQTELNEIFFGEQPSSNADQFHYQRMLKSNPSGNIPANASTIINPQLESYSYATVGLRFFAYLIDVGLLWFLAIIITNLLLPLEWNNFINIDTLSETELTEFQNQFSIFTSLLFLFKAIISIPYFGVLESRQRGQTLGMLFCRIRVIDYRFNRPLNTQQALMVALMKSMELILLFDVIAGKTITNIPWDANATPALIKNTIRLSQRIANVAVIHI
jgi:uncharacterized RDD family membrane protein YckC